MISFFVSVLVLWQPVYGSIVEINETTFNSLPPLYSLDEWSECQQPGDVYCLVDAVLTSQKPSPALNLLQASIESVGYCQQPAEFPVRSSSAALALVAVCTLLCTLAALATALHTLAARCQRLDGNKYILAFSLIRNWEILTYDRSKPRTDRRMKDIACIEGIRFIGTQCVIFSHVMLIYFYSYIDNPHFIENMFDQIGWKAVLNSPVWLQAFFSLSGFLTAYTVLVSSARSPITLYKCFAAVVNRYIRMTPLAVFALWVTISWFPLLGSGPQWSWVVTRAADDCAERWWYHALYVHNHVSVGKFCMGHTWYLAADMQLHICGLLLMLVLMQRRSWVGPVLVALVTGSALAAAIVLYLNDLSPIITAQAPEGLRTWFSGSKILSRLYLPMWMNLPGYAGGMTTAFFLHHIQQDGTIKLRQIKWFNILFHLSLTLGGCVVVSGTVFLADRPPPTWAAALYATADRTLVAVFFNIFLLGCFTNCKSIFSCLLEWRGFHPLGRLSYSVFLFHYIVLRLIVAGSTQLNHASLLGFISLVITTSTLSYLVSVPLCLLVELPAVQLWKAVTGEDTRASAPAPASSPAAPSPTDDVKPFDMLATV